jgi:hypothetical protein
LQQPSAGWTSRAAGFVHRHGPFVFVSRAAVRFDKLKT